MINPSFLYNKEELASNVRCAPTVMGRIEGWSPALRATVPITGDQGGRKAGAHEHNGSAGPAALPREDQAHNTAGCAAAMIGGEGGGWPCPPGQKPWAAVAHGMPQSELELSMGLGCAGPAAATPMGCKACRGPDHRWWRGAMGRPSTANMRHGPLWHPRHRSQNGDGMGVKRAGLPAPR
ncbi:UNVERIFIED_CONTAM: hypothetical protein K2H54_012709 [Gekko kuhli]